MPRRSDRPGFKRGRRGLPYWIAKQVKPDPMGFPDPCIALPPEADDEMIGTLCREHTASLDRWIVDRLAELSADVDQAPKVITAYDGSMKAACQIYQEHPHSGFHGVKHNTRKAYLTCLRRIIATVGARQIRNVTVPTCRFWYDEWRKADFEGDVEHIDRAHDTIAMVRTVIYFLASLRYKDCKTLAEELDKVKFEKGAAREAELTYQQAVDFIRTALELGKKGVMPFDRALHMAIGVAAQFELLLRQMDIIGEWAPTGAKRKIPAGVARLDHPSESWIGFFTWEHIAGWRWRMKTSKSKYRAAQDFDLTRYSLLHPLLEMVPLTERTGAIVKGEHGLPVRARSYGNWFRDIAQPAGIPDGVWNMDSRAGGATEAYDAGAALGAIQDAMTHTEPGTTVRYIRRRSKGNEIVADARSKAPWRNENDGGTG